MTQPVPKSEVKEKIRGIISNISLRGDNRTLGDDEDLFSLGALDSVVLIGLITQIEDGFQIRVSPTEYSPENFMTINGLGNMVNNLLVEQRG